MKKNKTLRIAVLVLALALITSCFVGTTFAKYASSATGSASTQVAKWNVTVNGTDVSASGSAQTVAFDLFETVLDTKDGAAEADVATGKIAPGTKGSFDLALASASEVTVNYTITLTLTNDGNVPLTWTGATFDDTTKTATITGTFTTSGGTETKTIGWEWVYDGDHNAIGIATPSVTVAASIAFEQVD